MHPTRLALLLAALIAGSLVASLAAPGLFALEAEALAQGQLWRLWSGHLVHWSVAHFAWDATTFVALGWLFARLAPRTFGALLLFGAPLVSLAVLVFEPQLRAYGGLSGLDVALFVALCLVVARRVRERATRVVALLALALCLAKVAAELVSGEAAFVGGEVVLAASAHAAGVVLGLLAGLAACRGHLRRHERWFISPHGGPAPHSPKRAQRSPLRLRP